MNTKIGIGLYLFVMIIALLCALGFLLFAVLPTKVEQIAVGLRCAAVGGLGGCLYCLRGMYLNISVRRQWGDEWIAWYLIRPIASIGCGAIAYLFLKAGLLILESGTDPGASELGFYALAFVGGYNVDKFLSKLEDIAQSVWGIEKSRTSSNKEKD
jgi:hypothetical protein